MLRWIFLRSFVTVTWNFFAKLEKVVWTVWTVWTPPYKRRQDANLLSTLGCGLMWTAVWFDVDSRKIRRLEQNLPRRLS